jgi:hypothetical protein
VAGMGMDSNIHHTTHKAEIAPTQQASALHPESLIAKATTAASSGPAMNANWRGAMGRMN